MNVIMKIQIMLNENIKFMKNKMKVLIIKVKLIIRKISYSNNYKNERKKNIRVFSKIGESIYYNKNEDKLLEKKSRNLDLENVENSNKVIKDDNL